MISVGTDTRQPGSPNDGCIRTHMAMGMQVPGLARVTYGNEMMGQHPTPHPLTCIALLRRAL